MADEKGAKPKKGGAKGKKEDGPAQNGETKTNEVRGGAEKWKTNIWLDDNDLRFSQMSVHTPTLH